MIGNEKQYKISKKRLAEVQLKISEVSADATNGALRNKLLLASLNNQLTGLQKEIRQYELLKRRKKVAAKARPLDQLPQLITEYKIASGLTQKELSQKLGMKEQQLQRYEANRFKGISFDNLLQLVSAMDVQLEIRPVLRRRKGH